VAVLSSSEEKGERVSLNTLKAFGAALLTPKFLFSPSPAAYYDFLGDDVIEGADSKFSDPNKPLWLNLGYWKVARTYPEAAEAMATKLGDAAELGPSDELLDVGFGFGEQDLFWLSKYGVKKIVGLNITPKQVERARARVEERGVSDRIDLKFGSATEVPFPDGSFDKVTALECAHHFDTREQFFREAFRVLRPGGRIATADGARFPGSGPVTLVNKMALRRWSVPLANLYDRNEYMKRLEAAGFVNPKCESIRNYVFPGIGKYHALRNRGMSMAEARIDLSQEEIDSVLGLDLWETIGLTDYVIFSAEKPR
jgi:microcystin synthetase protein McyJ